MQSLTVCRSCTLVVKVHPTLVVITKATSNLRVRYLATAAPRKSGPETADDTDLCVLRRKLAIARSPARREQVISRFRAILEQEMRIHHSLQNVVLLRMAEGIFGFVEETNLACGCVSDKSHSAKMPL